MESPGDIHLMQSAHSRTLYAPPGLQKELHLTGHNVTTQCKQTALKQQHRQSSNTEAGDIQVMHPTSYRHTMRADHKD
jgi:hypothetical protein